MENTVTISLKEYDELREFKARMEEDKIMIKLNTYGPWSNETHTFIPATDAMKALEIEFSKLKAELETYKKKNTEPTLNAFEKKKPWYKKLF